MQPTARLAVSHHPYGHFGTVGSRWLHAEGLAALDAPPMGGDGGNQLPSSLVLAQRHGRNVQLDLHGVGQTHQRQAAGFQQCFQRLFIAREAQPEVVGLQPLDARDQVQLVIGVGIEHHMLAGALQFAQQRTYRHGAGHPELVQTILRGHGQETRHETVVGTWLLVRRIHDHTRDTQGSGEAGRTIGRVASQGSMRR